MKYALCSFAVVFTLNASAGLIHKDGQGQEPSAARTQMAKQCFDEAISSGCRHPREGRQEFRSCVRENLETFSSECRGFITRKYGRKA